MLYRRMFTSPPSRVRIDYKRVRKNESKGANEVDGAGPSFISGNSLNTPRAK